MKDKMTKDEYISHLETELQKISKELSGWENVVREHNEQFNKLGNKFLDFYCNDYKRKIS